jgi:hypothetical protein
MVYGDRRQVHAGAHLALVRVAIERRPIDLRGQPVGGRDAAIGDARIPEVLVADGDLGAVAGPDGERRIDPGPLEIDPVPEAAGALEHAVQPERHLRAERPFQIRRRALVAVAARLNRE